MFSPIENAGTFLISIIFDLYLLALMLRMVLHWLQVDAQHPVLQLLIKITEPIVQPLRAVFPKAGRFDIACISLWVIVDLFKWFILIWVSSVPHPGILGIVFLLLADGVKVFLDIFFFAILIQVLMSWLNPTAVTPLTYILHRLSTPILQPIRRVVPLISGFDLSPLIALIGIKVVSMVMTQTLYMMVG